MMLDLEAYEEIEAREKCEKSLSEFIKQAWHIVEPGARYAHGWHIDAMKVDSAGNLWSSGPGGVRIITPAGKVLGQILIPETVANIAFAEDGKTVYLTGSTSLYRLHVLIPGEIPLYYRR